MKSRPTASKKRQPPSKDTKTKESSKAARTARGAPNIALKPPVNVDDSSKERGHVLPNTMDQPLKQGSTLRETPVLHKSQLTSVRPDHRTDSNDPYSPESENVASFDSASATPPSNTRSTFDPSQQYPNALPDLGDIMFPSTDPFAYPNQPMMTLEGQNLFRPENTHMFGASDTRNHQNFAPLPPYLMQGPQFGFQPTGARTNLCSAGDTNTMAIDSATGAWHSGQPQDPSGPGRMRMGYNQFFGQDWTDQNYRRG